MLGYSYTLTNSFNGKSFTIGVDDSGVAVCQSGNGILLQDYPNFVLDVRNEERQKLGQHGIWDFFSYYGKRNITFSGIILGSTHLDVVQWQQKIQEVLTLPAQPIDGINDGYIAITWTDAAGLNWQINAKIQQDVTFSRNIGNQLRSTFFVGLKAESPFILSQTSKTKLELHGWRKNGLFIPAFLPSYFNKTYLNLINIYQAGTADAPAVYKLNGPITTAKITQLRETFANDTILDNFTTGWIGGTDDISNFQTAGMSQKLTSTGVKSAMSKTAALNLTEARYITFYFYVDDVDNMFYGGDEYFNNKQIIDNMEYANDGAIQSAWVNQQDGDNPTIDTTDFREGGVSGIFPWTNSSNSAIFTKTLITSDVSNLTGVSSGQPTEGVIGFWYKCSDFSVTTQIQLRFGSNVNADYARVDIAPTNNDWNWVELDLKNASIVGTPDWTAFTGIRFYVAETSSASMKIDGIKLLGEQGNYVKFIETEDTDEFRATLSLGNKTIKTGWNYFTLLKDQFEIIGAPSWEDISSIELGIKAKTGTALNISFDDLHNRDITYSERKLELTGTIAADDYAEFDVLEGTIVNSSGTDLSSNLTSDSEWFFLYPKQNLLLMESNLTPEVSGVFPYVYNDPLPETGLVGYWHFDEDALTDYLGNNDGSVTDSVNFVDSSVHESLRQIELDGASNISMTCPYDNFQVTSATVSMWIEFDDFSADHVIFSRLFGDATYPYLEYDNGTDKLILHYKIDGAVKTLDLATSVSSIFSKNTPYNLNLKFDVTTGVSSWFNLTTKVSDIETGSAYNAGINTIKFGVNAGDTVYHRGRLDEIRLYNILLTEAQRTQLFYTPEQNKLLQQIQVTWQDATL